MTAFSWEEIQKHNTEDDTWVVLHGTVYSVSKYLEDHPGGKEILLEVAGQDATKIFEEALHSEDARDILPRLKVGNVKEYQRPDGASSPVSILGPQAAEKRESRANVVISVTAPLAVTTLLGYHRDKLSSLWSAPFQSLTDADPIWLLGGGCPNVIFRGALHVGELHYLCRLWQLEKVPVSHSN